MQKFLTSRIGLAVAILALLSLSAIDVSAQRRTRGSQPRITNPPITVPDGEPRIISTADENSEENTSSTAVPRKSAKSSVPQSEQEQMQETINNLSNQVTQLTQKLGEMQEQQRALLDMERLSRAEQRAENLRAQLREVEEKEANLQMRLEEVEFASTPENVERAMASFGSTRPENAREYRRQQLINEKGRITSQLKQLANSRVRLEAAVASADRQVDILRERLEKLDEGETESVKKVRRENEEETPPESEPLPE